MGFLKPKVPEAPPPPKPATPAQDPISTSTERDQLDFARNRSSLISTSSQGLKRRASTQRQSLIGG